MPRRRAGAAPSSRSSPRAARSSPACSACCSRDLATNRALGPIASIGIASRCSSALTFLPALLRSFGRAAFWPFIPKHGDRVDPRRPTQPRKGLWPRQARFVARHARAGLDRLHRRAARRPPSASCSSRPTACRRATSCSAPPRRATARRCSPSTSRRARAARCTSSSPEDELADAVEVLARQRRHRVGGRGLRRLADRPGRRRRSRTARRCSRALGPPGTPAPEPTVVDGDVLLDRHADAMPPTPLAAEDTVRELRTEPRRRRSAPAPRWSAA